MKDKINKLAKGIIEADQPQISVSENSFNLLVNCGEISRFDISIKSENRIALKGLIYSDNPDISFTKKFFGGVNTSVGCYVNAVNLRDGESIKGEISLVSNAGELSIPYKFTGRSYASAEIISTLENISDFSRLYLSEKEMAVRIFDYNDFYKADFMKDLRSHAYYDALKTVADRTLAVEEFIKALRSCDIPIEAKLDLPLENKKEPLYFHNLEDSELLFDLVSFLIKNSVISDKAFLFYKMAVEKSLDITRLYEYFLYSLPEDYNKKFPKAIYLYFLMDNDIDSNLKLALYYNILLNFNENDDIYIKYSSKIRDFAIEELFKRSVNAKLAYIYERFIYSDMIDENIAKILPSILKSFRFRTSDKRAMYLVVKHLKLNGEEVYRLDKGEAYIPFFFDDDILLIQDDKGDRYVDFRYEKDPVMNKPSLLKKCYSINPDHPMLKLREVDNILKNPIKTNEELEKLEDILRNVDISILYREKIIDEILLYHSKHTRNHDKSFDKRQIDFLVSINPSLLSNEMKKNLIVTLIKLDCYETAYKNLINSAITDVDMKYMEKLLRYRIAKLKDLGDNIINERILDKENISIFSKHLFLMGSRDNMILNYLCENFNGLSSEMLDIMRVSEKEKIDISALSERLLAQMLFTEKRECLDYVYLKYRTYNENVDDILVRAYISRKSADYFISAKEFPDSVFEEIFNIAKESSKIENVPLIYILALSKKYSEKKSIKPFEKTVLLDIMKRLVKKSLIFAYTPELAKFVPIPAFIMDREYIEYHGDGETKPALLLKLSDNEEYHEEEMKKVYQNIYVASVALFEGESLDYKICRYDRKEILRKGHIDAKKKFSKSGGVFNILNNISAYSKNMDNTDKLKTDMKTYALNKEIIGKLFVN